MGESLHQIPYLAEVSGLAWLSAGDAAVEGGEAGFSDSPGMLARALRSGQQR